MIAFLFFIFISFLHSNDIKPQNIEPGRRGDLYKVWVYFDKKELLILIVPLLKED